jgi:hypothetical protein
MKKTLAIALLFLIFSCTKKMLAEKETVVEERNLDLGLLINENYFEIWAYGGSLPKIFYKEEGENLWVLHRESEDDPGKIEYRSAYEELAEWLFKIHKRFDSSPDINQIIIAPEKDVLFSKTGENKIINVAKTAVNAGFLKFRPFIWKSESKKEQDEFLIELKKTLKKVPGLELKETSTQQLICEENKWGFYTCLLHNNQ